MKIYRRAWVMTSLVMIIALALAACGGTAATDGDTGADSSASGGTDATDGDTGAESSDTGGIDCKGASEGDEVSLLYQWSGVEEEALNSVLQPVAEACGIVFAPESTRDQALLDTRVSAGTPPDLAFWNITQLDQYQDVLFEMDALGASQDAYVPGSTDPGVIDGRWLGLPVKSDVKSLIWYSPATFDALGYDLPTTWEELDTLVEQMVSDGNVPWSMGFGSGDATGWTGTDFIQDILLVQQGPDYVMGIIDGSVAYNDAGVAEAYETYGAWATDPAYTVGGSDGTLSTGFLDAIYLVFSDPPQAMMVKQSGFAGGEIVAQYPDLTFGTDYDFFIVPGARGLQGGSDWMMAFSDSPAVQAVVSYLASPAGGAAWAQATFGLTPNLGGAGNYTDDSLIKTALSFYAAEGFTPDIGDSIPGGFGAAEFSGISDYVGGADLQEVLDTIAGVQAEALGE